MLSKSEAFERYGHVPCKFAGYYKYTFDFVGHAGDGVTVVVSVGGNAADIYRLDVTPESVRYMDQQKRVKLMKDDEVLFEAEIF